MTDARHALLGAVYEVLTNDDALDAMLSGGKVYDGVPRGAEHPFVAFGDLVSAAIDTDAPISVAHRMEIDVHSRAGGQREASFIAERIRTLLDDAALPLEGHRLVSIHHRDTAVAASRDRRAYRARLRFRAVTEAN